MSTSKHIDKICIFTIVIALVMTTMFIGNGVVDAATPSQKMAYESTIFDTSYVHQIDIVMNDWDSFLENCENEEYVSCTVVIDGEKCGNIGIRAKGKTSLSSVKSLDSERYSFKLEFDHYEEGKTYDGLDKLCLNNLIQDNTMMKDYLVYQMMADFGVDAPLCSYAYITVNGEDWGLYLAVESIEDSFLTRNYGSESGELYKPDSVTQGFGNDGDMPDHEKEGERPDRSSEQENVERLHMSSEEGESDQSHMPPGQGEGDRQHMPGDGGRGGMGSDDVKLKYIDDDPDSYTNIFENAKTDVTEADKKRLIASLKNLSEYTELEDTVNIEEVLRYFVIHNFVCNGDSYTGSMIHNYYLYESDGELSMIPWDYNLGFGTFQGNDDASSAINASIDEPVTGNNLNDRPMVGWIFSDEVYTSQYHQLFSEFIEKWFSNGELSTLIQETARMIAPYVEKDPTKFCTTEEFEKGVEVITSFVELRAEAVTRQLSGDNTVVETDGLNLAEMGTMNNGRDRGESNRDQRNEKF